MLTSDSNWLTYLRDEPHLKVTFGIRVQLADSTVLRAIDHDVDLTLTVGSFGAELYESMIGIGQRSNIRRSGDLQADIFEIRGALTALGITRNDILAKRYRSAKYHVFMFRWDDLTTYPTIPITAGLIGDITWEEDFELDLRSMIDQLQQKVVDLLPPSCPLEFMGQSGARFCGLPSNPALWASGFTYENDDPRNGLLRNVIQDPAQTENFWFELKEGTGGTTAGGEILPIGNPDFEAGNPPTPWVGIIGVWSADVSHGGVGPHSGSRFLRPPNSAADQVEQIVDLQGITGWSAIDADAGFISVSMQVWRQDVASDQGRILFQALDGSDVFISTLYDSGFETITSTWQLRQSGRLFVPSGTRKVKIRFEAVRSGGGENNVGFDLVSGAFHNSSSPPTFDFAAEGNETVEGSITWVARYARVVPVEITTVTNDITLVVAYSGSAPDSFFEGGKITFTSGDLNTYTEEIETWDLSTKTIVLALPLPILPAAMDTLNLIAGCDKTMSGGCTTYGNQLQFGGEHHNTGNRELLGLISPS